jgi:predicted secreted protein
MATVKVEGNESVEVHPGEEVTLEVTGANTTGYLWHLNANPEAVEFVGHEVVADLENFGGAGIERFVVRLLCEGDSMVRLELKAPWETEPVEIHDVQVHSTRDA